MAEMNISAKLQGVHTRMKNKYLKNTGKMAQEIKQAEVLTEFLKTLKEQALARKVEPAEKVQQNIYDLILDNIRLPNGRTLYNLFRRTGKSQWQGAAFEQDFAAVVKSVMELADPTKKVSIKEINVGSQVGTTSLDAFLNELSDAEERELAELTAKEIKNKKLPFVFAKIDTQVNEKIVNLNSQIEFPSGVLEALSESSFTDKSYRSEGWDKQAKEIRDLTNSNIHFGSSNEERAVFGSLRSLGIKEKDIPEIYFGGRELLASSPKIEQHFFHLRFMYELTGAGILYKNSGGVASKGAKFVVYNDPSSEEIIVKPTSKIIYDFLQNTLDSSGSHSRISIAKSYFRR